MIKQVTRKQNLNEAYLQVYRNKGAGGVDGVQIDELQDLLHANSQRYTEEIEEGKYQVSPILGVELSKAISRIQIKE